MNILLIGNGFDLAHELPTKYGDFLEWVKVIRQVSIIENGATLKDVDWGKTNIQVKEFIINNKMNGNMGIFSQEKICNELLNDNIWIDYFLQCDMYQKENWIDFEREISRVIQAIDNDMKRDKLDENMIVRRCTEPFLEKTFLNDYEQIEQARNQQAYEAIEGGEKSEGRKWSVGEKAEHFQKYREEHPIENLKSEITYRQLIVKLETDLDRLIRALEVYLAEYVDNIIRNSKENKIVSNFSFNTDHVLSFNYSNTFEWIYGKGKRVEYDYIHGKADISNTIESNNMVLGIDEYLSPEKADKEIDFIAFKKYYQRIYKGTGCKHKDWLYEIKESKKTTETKLRSEYPIQIPFVKFNKSEKHNLFIFGHSLDITDKDILRDLILNDNIYTEIYCVDKKDLKRKISNLVKVIGPDELVRRTGGSTETIKFIKMQ